MFAALTGVAAQTAADAQRLAAAGARRVAVTGNVKFDAAVPDAALRVRPHACARASARTGRCGSRRPRARAKRRCCSTRWRRRRCRRGTLTIIVPRHPQRFDAVADLLTARGIAFARRSANLPVEAGATVLLGDSLGELLGYYAAADVAFVGGSLLPLGGQNLLEAIAVGTPTLVGPHTFNFEEATASAVAAGAAIRVADAPALLREVARLLATMPRSARGCATRPSRSTPRIAAPPTACGRGSRRSCRAPAAPAARRGLSRSGDG